MRIDSKSWLGFAAARKLLASCALLCWACSSTAESVTDVPFDAGTFERYVAEHLQLTGIPGVSVAITRGTQVVLVAGYGKDSTGAPMTGRTPMFAGSVSKSFTALAVMQLVEAGRVDLDTPVQRYLPEFELADPRYVHITARQLLNQTSGMADAEFFEWTNPGPASLEEAVARLRPVRLVAEPGTQFNYHNPNFAVAARLVEVVSGQSFATYMREHVFAPLGMTGTSTVDRADDLQGSVPQGHVFVLGRAYPVRAPAFFLNGAAGIVTSAEDMARWLIVHSNGGVGANGVRILSAQGIELMHTASATSGNYGLGWVDGRPRQSPRVEHAGWVPTFTANQSVSLDGRYDVAVLSNGARTFLRGSLAGYVENGVQAMEQGQPPVSYGVSTEQLDKILCVAAIVVLVLAAVGARRSRRWAALRVGRSIWVTVLLLTPYAVALLFAMAVPKLAIGLLVGRSVAWSAAWHPSLWLWIFYMSPILVAFCAVLAGASGLVLILRTLRLFAANRSRTA